MIDSLKPRAVIAGHKRLGRPDAPSIVGETKQYIRDFDRIAATAQTAKELYEQMLAIYPDRSHQVFRVGDAADVKGLHLPLSIGLLMKSAMCINGVIK